MYCPTKEQEAIALDVSAWIKTPDGWRQRLLCSECGAWHWVTEKEEVRHA